MSKLFTWSRTKGYEVSSKGDTRFSAFYARMGDSRSIEEHYQGDCKGYCPGGTNWRLGKGKPGLLGIDLYACYLNLWKTWANSHRAEMHELYLAAKEEDYTLRDRFATTDINQARALAEILNEWYVLDFNFY